MMDPMTAMSVLGGSGGSGGGSGAPSFRSSSRADSGPAVSGGAPVDTTFSSPFTFTARGASVSGGGVSATTLILLAAAGVAVWLISR